MLATLGLSFLKKSFEQFSAPQKFATKGKERKKEKPIKTIIPTIGFGKI